jgi:hypothetical protein
LNARLASFATLIAIALAAYFVADVVHEGLGHGGACLLSGGRSLLVDTTFQDCSIRSRWIDGAGPITGIVVALLAWMGARKTDHQNLRLFLTLVFVYAIFWNIGYMVKSGTGYSGDWHFLIAGLEPASVWHAVLVAAGVALYIVAMRMLALVWPSGEGMSSAAFAITAFLAAAALSAAAGYFDPRGPQTMLSDALPSSLAAFGFVLVGIRSRSHVAVPPSVPWTVAGFASAVIFVAILGPGLRF